MLHERITLVPGRAVDAEARIYLKARPAGDVQQIAGELYGPRCEYARTLPATFAVHPAQAGPSESSLASVLVPDPCFWTPTLPFLYDLDLRVTSAAGETQTFQETIALKRFATAGKDWKLEGRRYVLRGAVPSATSIAGLESARKAEASLLVCQPNEDWLASASRWGVPILVDARAPGKDLGNLGSYLSWHPAVFSLVIDAKQLEDSREARVAALPLGIAITARSQADEFENRDFDYYVAELNQGERPPAWLLDSGKPAIAIRRGEDYADLGEARAACDRLQAELAPEFNLAGYYVAS